MIVGAWTGDFPARMRAAGAKTVYWDMYLKARVGSPGRRPNPDTIVRPREQAVRLRRHADAAARRR